MFKNRIVLFQFLEWVGLVADRIVSSHEEQMQALEGYFKQWIAN
jgi:hypothetical protein